MSKHQCGDPKCEAGHESAMATIRSHTTARGPIVYFIRAIESGRIKIGTTKGWAEKRMAALQTGNAERLEFLCYVPGGKDKEFDLHREFADLRLHGEWFSPGQELLAYIEAIRAGVDGVRRVRAAAATAPPPPMRTQEPLPPPIPRSQREPIDPDARVNAERFLKALYSPDDGPLPLVRRRHL